MSLAGAEAARQRNAAASMLGYYDIELGRTYWNVSAALGAAYDSNVELSQSGKTDDYVFRPEIDVGMLMPVSDKNSLTLAAGAGYSAYVMHSNLRRFYVTPNTGASFDVYVGDFWINLHDRVAITENSYQDPTVAGNGGYSQLQNAVGLSALWDLNKAVVKLGYDHVNYVELSGAVNSGGQPSGESELFSSSAGYYVASMLQAGVEVGGGFLTYNNPSTNFAFSNAAQWNAGAFCEAQPSEYIRLRASVGYTEYIPTSTKSTNQIGNFRGVYAQLDLTHRVNQYVDYTLSGGRSINFAFYGGTVDLYFARLGANWKIFQKTSLATGFEFDHGSQLGYAAETFDRYGPSVSLARPITRKLSGDLGCQYYWRGSNLPGRSYSDFIVSTDLRYKF